MTLLTNLDLPTSCIDELVEPELQLLPLAVGSEQNPLLQERTQEPPDQPEQTLLDRSRRPTDPTVSVVIPTLNEARNLPYAMWRLPDCVTEVIVVDGRSSDDTVLAASLMRP